MVEKTKANIKTLSKNHFHTQKASYIQDPLFDLSLIIQNSEEFLLVINRNYELIMCNHVVIDYARRSVGVEIQMGMSVFLLVAEEEKEKIRMNYDRVFNGEKVEFEYCLDPLDGEKEFFQVIFKPAKDASGQVVGAIIIATNVTDKKKAFQTIVETEQRWRFALEGTNQGVWEWNIKTGEVYFSPSWRKMLGYNENEITSCINEWKKLLHPEDRNKMELHIENHFQSVSPYYESEQRLKAKDGDYRWVLSRGMIIERLIDGAPLRMIGTHTDITERKNIEEGYKLLFYNNPLPMWTIDRHTLRFLNVNNAAVEHYGYSREEFLQMTILDIRPEEDKGKVKQHILNSPNECQFSETRCWRHKKKNGDIIYVNLVGKTLANGNEPNRTLVLAEDITEQILAEEKLKQSETQYRALFRNNPLPSFIFDLKTFRFLEVNDAAIEYYGYSDNEFSKISLLDLHLPQHHEALKKSIAKNKNRQVVVIPNWKQINKAGEELTGDISASPIEYNGHNARLVVVNDTTPRVKAERLIQETNRRFEFVAQATSDIIWDWDIKNGSVFFSENYRKIFGWELPDDHTVNLDFVLSKCHPEDLDRMNPRLKEVFDNPSVYHWEEQFRYLRADGTYAYINDKAYISRNEKGEAIRMAGALEDISERRYHEELQSLELRVFEVSVIPGIHFHNVLKTLISGYENLHPGIQASICLMGLADEVEILAPKLAKEHCRQLRYFIEGLKNKLLAQDDVKNIILSSADSDDWKPGVETANFYNWKISWTVPVHHHHGGLLAFVTVFLDQERQPSDLEKNTLNRLKNLLRILMINHLSLEQIRVSNERYNNMLRATHDLVWDWNLETGNFYRNSEGLKKVYGIEDEKSIQNVYSWMERIHPSDHIKVQRVINDILHATDQDTFDVEYRFKRDDGEYAFIYDRGVIVRNKEGKPLRMIGAAQNVTDRKRLEQELLQQELDKQKFISQATIDTQEQERREIGKELHDNVNQVLTTTKLYLDLSLSSPDLKDELIKKSSKNIIYVINEIRQLSRSLMDPSIGDLGLLDSINDLVENINITRKLHVSLSAASDLEKYLDESQKLMIFRVIQEAMNNTIKYAQATSVQIHIKINAGNLELLIADDGKGFEVATIKKGAGLKNIQNRVYLTGGNLVIESAPGKGCKIIINFPINKQKSE